MSLDFFSDVSPTYGWKKVIPTMGSYYLSDQVSPGMKQSPLDMVRAAGGVTPKAQLDLVVTCTVGKAGPDKPMTIHVSLENSHISSGNMLWDDDDKRGYFQDLVEVGMYLIADGGRVMQDFDRAADGPQTANGSSSTSSSVSVSFSAGASANIGFFGDTPTAGAGLSGSVGITNTHAFARNLTDFKVINHSDQRRILHEYKMSASSGGKYDRDVDLVPDHLGFGESFSGIKLHHPPALATSNLPLISQAVWQANSNKEYDQTIQLGIIVRQRTILVEGTNNFGKVAQHADAKGFSYRHSEDIVLKPFKSAGDGIPVPPPFEV